jgi:hypothetical protein
MFLPQFTTIQFASTIYQFRFKKLLQNVRKLRISLYVSFIIKQVIQKHSLKSSSSCAFLAVCVSIASLQTPTTPIFRPTSSSARGLWRAHPRVFIDRLLTSRTPHTPCKPATPVTAYNTGKENFRKPTVSKVKKLQSPHHGHWTRRLYENK